MRPHRKKKLWRWTVRIGILIVVLPLASLIIVRAAGWLDMRETDREIRAHLSRHGIDITLDTVFTPGHAISYVRTTRGAPKTEALVMVHGSPGSLDACLDYLRDTSLLARADIIAYDRPGFGHSEFGRALPSLARQGDVLNWLLDDLGYKRYWLVGHSYGAAVIVQATVRRPDRIAGLCLVAGSVSPGLESRSLSWRKWLDLPVVRDILPVTLRVSNEELMPLRMDLDLLENEWADIREPVSLIHGTEDVLVPVANVEYATGQLTSADTVMTRLFEGESHFIFWTRQPAIAAECLKLMEVSNERQ